MADLCARLPYGVKVTNGIYTITLTPCSDTSIIIKNEHILPYLRPMSSMTEEERKELRQEQIKDEQLFTDCIKNHPERRGLIVPHFASEWCDKNMFDHRGLIPKGLALEAPEGMYNNKEEQQ